MARGSKFEIEEVEGLHHLCSKNKGVNQFDQLAHIKGKTMLCTYNSAPFDMACFFDGDMMAEGSFFGNNSNNGEPCRFKKFLDYKIELKYKFLAVPDILIGQKVRNPHLST